MAARRGGYALLVTLVWLLLTAALAGIVAHSATALDDYVTPQISDGYMLLAAFAFAAILGLMIGNVKLLLPATAGMVLGASALFGMVLYLPAWMGLIPRAVAVQNYATQQALFIALWTLLPSLPGALAGNLLGAGLRRAALDPPSPVDTASSWWERRGD